MSLGFLSKLVDWKVALIVIGCIAVFYAFKYHLDPQIIEVEPVVIEREVFTFVPSPPDTVYADTVFTPYAVFIDTNYNKHDEDINKLKGHLADLQQQLRDARAGIFTSRISTKLFDHKYFSSEVWARSPLKVDEFKNQVIIKHDIIYEDKYMSRMKGLEMQIGKSKRKGFIYGGILGFGLGAVTMAVIK